MRKIRKYILKGQEVFVGLEDSKKTWKICVRSNKLVVHESSMPAQYEVLRNYFNNKFLTRKITKWLKKISIETMEFSRINAKLHKKF